MATKPNGKSGVLSSNFLFGILFLPSEQRAAVKAIYAFCRVADDAADIDPAGGADGISLWREELALLYKGTPRHRIMKELFPHLGRYKLKREYFEKLLKGMEMDLSRRRYQTMEELEEYCACVAGAVGLLCLQVFELHEDERVRTYSTNLSLGLQLTNIIRDVGDDVAIDRVYLPQDDFGAFGYTEKELKAGVVNIGYFNLMRFMVGRTRSYFSVAERAIDMDLRKKLIGSEIMRATYMELLEKISHALDASLDRNSPRLLLIDKISIALGTWIKIKVA